MAKMINEKIQKAIKAKKSGNNCNLSRQYSRIEVIAMKDVMYKTEGKGGPWFEQYAIKKGLL